MIKKKIISLIGTLAFVSTLGISAFAEDTPKEEAYYVCFSYDNYQVKNTNKMQAIDIDSDGVVDYYSLANKSLSSSMDFYVIDQNEEKYYAADGSNMKVEDSSTYRYNLYFSKDYVYNEEKIAGTELEATNAHISYEFYVPGNYSMDINGNVQSNFKYNQRITSYDAYILPEVELHKDDVVTITDMNTIHDPEPVKYTKVLENSGVYRLVFTPTVKKNSNEYCFNAEGSYGTGEEYTENIYISDVEYYYISFHEELPIEEEETTFTYKDTTIRGYRLVKSENQPEANVFESAKFFNTSKNHKIKYEIYHYSYIFNSYELIDDDNDDTKDSEIKVEDISWYQTTFSYAESKYTTQFISKTTDFGNYYIVGDFNHYGFTSTGDLNLEEKYMLSILGEDSPYYDEEHKQYILKDYAILKDMLDEDEDAYQFIITNGKDKTSLISIQTPGKYDILYSKETNYNGISYKYIRTEESDEVYSYYEIYTKEEFLSYIDAWNLDSEATKYVVFNIMENIDFSDTTISSVSIFHGMLNGNGHTLSNITIEDKDGRSDIGFFRVITKYATIKNLNIENITILAEDSEYVGFIAKNYGTLDNIHISGKIKGKKYTGGVVGYNGNYSTDSGSTTDSSIHYGYGILKNVTSKVEVYGEINIGGLCGFSGGKIISSCNEGKVNHKSYSSSVTITNVGGLAGYATGEILDSKNNGIVGYANIGSNIGGLCGLLNGEIYFSENTARVEGKMNVGGICGYYGSTQDTEDSKNQTIITNPEDYIAGTLNTKENTSDFQEEQDISKHIINYCISTGNIHGVRYVGGVIGYNNSTTLALTNSIVKCDVYADSGSYVGGIAGYFNGGNMTSISYCGYIEANGSINRYVGGIAGYNNGTITACHSNATLSGGEYVGGICGYVTSSGSILSSYANVYMITNSKRKYVGNIAGYIDGIDTASGTYGDRVKYNYYLGSDLSDYSGINNVNYAKASQYAACRILFSDVEKNHLLKLVSKKFGLIDEDENTFYYKEAGKYLPYLNCFLEMDEIEDSDFDDDTDSYQSYAEYYALYATRLRELEEMNSIAKVRFVFKEWDPDTNENKEDNYVVVSILEYNLGNLDEIQYPELKYVDHDNYTTRSDAEYRVVWETFSKEIKNQSIYATYEELKKSIYIEAYGMFIENSTFSDATTVTVSKENDLYTILIKDKDGAIKDTPVSIKVFCDKPKQCYVTVHGEKIESKVYGQYITFDLDSSLDSFRVIEGPYTYSMLPDYVKALIYVVPALILIVILVVISNVKKSKKEKEFKKEEAQSQPSHILSPEEKKERQLENLRKAREAKQKKQK